MTTTESPSFLDTITHISRQLEAGRHDDARDAFEHALTQLATPEDLDRLVRLADTFTHFPYGTARAYLRSLWRRSDSGLKEWLDTFVTRSDPGLHRPHDEQPRWITTVPITALDWKVRRMVARDPNRKHTGTPTLATKIAAKRAWEKPEHIAAITSKRRPVPEPRVVTDYFRTRFLVDTDPADQRVSTTGPLADKRPAYRQAMWDRNYVRQVAEQILAERDRAGARTREDFNAYAIARTRTGLDVREDDRPAYQTNGNGLDYDHTTIAPLQGWVCVYCFGERACSDHFRTDIDGRRVSDDGLCQHCRDTGRSGISALPAGFTLADEVAAYCQYLTDHYPAAAPGLLDGLRQRSTRVVRGLILAFLNQQKSSEPDIPVTVLTPVALRKARCCACYAHDRLVDTDDLCDECRSHFLVAA